MPPLRVAVLGTSFGGSVHVAGYRRHPGFEVAGVAGTDPERTRRVAEAHGVPAADTDWRRLLDTVRPDVVSVVTPVDLHHPMTLAALERGCHVLCEKPTAMNRHQAAEMRDRAAGADRVLAINHEFRYFPARLRALELVKEGAIGRPRRGEIVGRYTMWARPDSRPMNWLCERHRGGGVLGALGSHHTDCLRTHFGEPEQVWASLRLAQPKRGPTASDARHGIATADDGFVLHLSFPGGITGLIDLDATSHARFERFEIRGDDGTLRWDENGYRLWRIPASGGVAPPGNPYPTAGFAAEELELPERLRLSPRDDDPALLAPFGSLLERFHAAIVDGAPMAPNFDDAVAVQSVLDAARRSSDSGTMCRVTM